MAQMTLADYLRDRLGGVVLPRPFTGQGEPFPGAADQVREIMTENFQLTCGYKVLLSVSGPLVREYYASRHYRRLDIPKGTIPLSEEIADKQAGIQNYFFVCDKPCFVDCARITPIANGLLGSVFSQRRTDLER